MAWAASDRNVFDNRACAFAKLFAIRPPNPKMQLPNHPLLLSVYQPPAVSCPR